MKHEVHLKIEAPVSRDKLLECIRKEMEKEIPVDGFARKGHTINVMVETDSSVPPANK